MAENNQGVINALKESNKAAAGVIKDELKDQFKPFTDQLTAPLQAMKAGIESLPGVGVTKKLFSAVSTPLKNAFTMDSKSNIEDQKKENEERREGEANKTLMEDIRDGILGIQEGLIKGLAGLKDKGLMGLGILAGLIAAPFAALVAFFTQLGAEIKMLDKFMKGGLSRLFRPIIKFFDAISALFDTNAKGMKGLARFERASKVFGRYTKQVFRFFDSIADAFRPISNGVRKALGFVKTSTAVMDGFKPVIKFAQTIGKTLGKIFLPITIIMTLFDTVSGAVKGYEDGGWLGALEGGLTGLINSIIGMPLDLLKSAVAWMLGMFGFDNAAEALKSFSFKTLISDAIGAVFDFGKKAFAWFGQLFTDPVTALSNLWTGLVGEGGFIDLITKPFNMAVNWLLGLFGWSDPETEFNLLSAVKNAFGMAVDWVKGLFSFGDEDATAAGITTKLIDILLAPYNLAVNFLMGLFGFSPDDFGQEGESFSIGKLVMDAIKGIYEWFKGLLDIDVGAIVESIPGASTVLKALGIMEESDAEKQANIESAIKEAQDRISRSEGGENVYFGREGKGREEDAEEIAELQKQLEALKAQGGGTVVNNIDNSTNNSGNSNSTTLSSTQLVDGAAPAGSKME